MKSAMPYRGVALPIVRAQTRRLAAQRPFADTSALRDTALELWRAAEFREERYAATELTDTPAARKLQSPGLLGLYREQIVTGAWWDHVDPVSQRVGALLLGWRDQIRPAVHEWATDEDHWLRRASVICQLKARERTDVALLTDAILASIDERDFFLRKAIGWALRAYAVTDPAWVRAFVAAHETDLSPLSRREALKHLG